MDGYEMTPDGEVKMTINDVDVPDPLFGHASDWENAVKFTPSGKEPMLEITPEQFDKIRQADTEAHCRMGTDEFDEAYFFQQMIDLFGEEKTAWIKANSPVTVKIDWSHED